jgi:hypothetical protein
MEVTILEKPAFRIVGIEGRGPNDAGPNWIPSLWEEANGRFSEVRDIIVPGTAWGSMRDVEEFLGGWVEGSEGRYIAGWELVEGRKLPQARASVRFQRRCMPLSGADSTNTRLHTTRLSTNSYLLANTR